MNHILKSLLLTSAFVLPSVFGADTTLAQDTTPLQGAVVEAVAPISIVEVIQRAGALERSGRPKAAARMYLMNADHDRVLWFDILFAASMMERLGFPHLSREAFARSKDQPNTKHYERFATAEIVRLERLPTLRSESTLVPVPKDGLQLVTGSVHENKFELGWLDLNDLASLALVSWDWNEVAQPMIEAANQWRHTDVVPRVIAGSESDYDRGLLRLFTPNPKTKRFDVVLDALLDSRIFCELRVVGDAIHAQGVNSNSSSNYTYVQLRILNMLLNPSSEVDEIDAAATHLKLMGSEYYNRAACLYEMIAKDVHASVEKILEGAYNIKKLGSKYNARAASLLKKVINDERASIEQIAASIRLLHELGVEYNTKVNFLLEKAADSDSASTIMIANVACTLQNLGVNYYPIASKLYDKAAQKPNASFAERWFCGTQLIKLGEEYHPLAAKLFISIAQDPNAAPSDILMVTKEGLIQLGFSYYPKTVELLIKIRKHKNATTHNIQDVADCLGNLGSEYSEETAIFYEAFARHKDSDPSDIFRAAKRVSTLGTEYSYRAAALYKDCAHLSLARDRIFCAQDSAIELIKLGSDFNEITAQVLESYANHKKGSILWAANMLANFGSKYYKRAAILVETVIRKFPKETAYCWFAREVAKTLCDIKMFAKALEVYQKIIENPETSSKDKESIQEEMAALETIIAQQTSESQAADAAAAGA